MTQQPKLQELPLDSSTGHSLRWLRYLVFWLGSNVAIWGLALAYVNTADPVYVSKWTINLPSAKAATNLNLPGIGQAFRESKSPYEGPDSQDPRETYKFIAESIEVNKAAAQQLGVKEFKGAKVKLVDNTTLIELQVSGGSPEEAQKKARIFHEAFEGRLDVLRGEEIEREDRQLQNSLNNAQRNLRVSQDELSSYKANSNLSSRDQLRDLSMNVEQLRSRHAEVVAKVEQADARLRQLSSNLGISSQQAANTLVLKSDPLFQQHLTNYSTVSSELEILESKFSPEHPEVIVKQAEKAEIQSALLDRSNSVLGSTNRSTLRSQPAPNTGENRLTKDPTLGAALSSEQETLFRELVVLQAERRGLAAEAQEMARQIMLLESRLKKLTLQGSKLDGLTRNVQIAEAIFSSTLAELDLSKSDIDASYPQTQILTSPNLPESPKPTKMFVLLGAVMASLFFTTGTGSLWWRSRIIQGLAFSNKPNGLSKAT